MPFQQVSIVCQGFVKVVCYCDIMLHTLVLFLLQCQKISQEKLLLNEQYKISSIVGNILMFFSSKGLMVLYFTFTNSLKISNKYRTSFCKLRTNGLIIFTLHIYW